MAEWVTRWIDLQEIVGSNSSPVQKNK